MLNRNRRPCLMIALGFLAATASAQETDRYVPVKAPYAEMLVRSVTAAHPEMTFIGIHVTPPGKEDNVIIACTDPSKIGRVSTALDMEVVKTKGTKVHFNKAKNDYEVDQWFSDANGNTLGMIVYHFTGSHAKSEDDAVRLATAISADLRKSIPDRDQLFSR